MNQDSRENYSSENRPSLSPEDIAEIGRLHAVIDREMEKPLEAQDSELIETSIQQIAERKGVKSTFTPEEINARIAIVMARAEADKAAAVRRPKRIKTALLAACLVVVMLAGAFAAYAVSPAVRAWFENAKIFGLGVTLTEKTVTYTCRGETKQFGSIEELLSAENFSIYYPMGLSEDIYIKNIVCVDINGGKCYSIGFNTADIAIRIYLDSAQTFVQDPMHEVYSNSVGVFYISQIDDSYKVFGIIDQDLYNITVKNTFDIKNILDTLKESVT